MAAEKVVVGGVAKGGVVVPDGEILLPEGAHVEIVFSLTRALPEYPDNGIGLISEQRPAPTSNGTAIKDHPLASSAGIFSDDPLWEEFIQAMEETRREIDAANPVDE